MQKPSNRVDWNLRLLYLDIDPLGANSAAEKEGKAKQEQDISRVGRIISRLTLGESETRVVVSSRAFLFSAAPSGGTF